MMKVKLVATTPVPAAVVKNIKNATASERFFNLAPMISWFRSLFLVTLSAVLLVLPFHFGGLGPLAFFAFIPYFFVLDRCSAGSAFKYSYFFGFIFFCLLGYWLTYVNILGFILLAVYLAFYFAFFGILAAKYLGPAAETTTIGAVSMIKTAIFLPAFWVCLEYVRGWMLGGLPWALLGYSQWKYLVFIQIADVTGAYGVSFFVLMVNIVFYQGIRVTWMAEKGNAVLGGMKEARRKTLLKLVLFFVAVFALVTSYGVLTLRSWSDYYRSAAEKAVLRVSVLQGSIPQDEKWDAKIKNIIFEKYKRLTFMSAVEKSDLIVWPETSFPGYLEDEAVMAAQLRNTVRQSRTDVLVGAPTMGDLEKGLRFYNSAVLYGSDGEERQRYSKIHLVPFGEYVPFEPILGVIRRFVQIGHFTEGSQKTIFAITSRYQKIPITVKFAALICYEDIFPGLVRDFCDQGADFLVNMTNDAWFGRTTAPYQHAQASIFRAVENRVNVVRATNTGLSCFIEPQGEIVATVKENGQEIFVTGHKGSNLILRKKKSFYTRFGDVFILICFIFCFLAFREHSKQKVYASI